MLISTENGFRIQGVVNFDQVVSIRQECEQWMQKHLFLRAFVIDLSDMKDQDASCFSLLLSLQRAAQKNNLSFSLINVPVSMERMGKMFGLLGILLL